MFSALSIGCTSRKIPPDAINMPNIRKTHDQSDFDNVPNAPKNCRNPIPVKIIPKKKQKNLTMARGETRNRQPRKILKNPCRPVERLVSLFLYENSKLMIPLNSIMAPMVITTDLRVNPGRERKTTPTAMVRIPLINAFTGDGRKNIFMI